MELLASDTLRTQSSSRLLLKRIFDTRKIKEPTSRPLYTYHITLEEYEDLKRVIRSSQQDQKTHKPGLEWCAVFTLFVSEWFRREYKSGWSWGPVYDVLGFQPLDDIRYVVQQGLEYFWKRPILKFESSNHTNYLGSAFKEGGFPSNLLMEKGNHYQAVFKRIIAQYSHYRHYNPEINDQLIQVHTKNLPQAFKEHETRLLISDMAEQLIHLVEVHQLDKTDNPATFLSENYPKWREVFPLPLESSVAEQFLNQLLLTSSTELKQMKDKQETLSCINFLNRNANQILTEIYLPDLWDVTLDNVNGIPPRVEIVLYEAHEPLAKLGTATFMQRPEVGKKVSLRIGAQTRTVTRKNYHHDLIFALQNKDQIIYQKELTQSALEIGDVPVAFAQDESDLCPFVGQASFKTPESEIILLLPPNFEFISTECVTGHLSNAFGQHVYKVKGEIEIIGSQQEQYQIQCSKYHDRTELVELSGQKLPWSTVPVLAFLGQPKARYIEPGLQSKNGSLVIYADKKPLAHHVGSSGYGVKTLTVKNSAQNVVLRRKAVIFPEDFKIELYAGNTPNEATIRVLTSSNVICAGITSDQQEIKYTLKKLQADTHAVQGYEYRLSSCEHPPENIKLSLMLSLLDQVDIHLPFPSYGATLYNGNHQPFKQRVLTVDDLLGSRLCLYAPENNFTVFWMTFRLKSTQIRDVDAPYYKWRFSVSGKPHQESLIHYRTEIEELLALTKDLDARIILEVTGGKQSLNYEIKHYQTEFEVDEQGHYYLNGLNLAGSKAVDPVDGKTFLIDPVMSGKASPFPWGTRAYKGTDIYTVDDLPEIDYLLISHDHYDHLDYETILKLKDKVKLVVTGLGVGEHFEHWGYAKNKLIEADWGDKMDFGNGISIITETAHHDSGRAFAGGQHLWVSFIIQSSERKIFYTGDGGYDKHFAEIGKKYGPFDWALMENGQYDPAWRSVHCHPDEVAQATEELQASNMIPVHHSKFSLAKHAWYEPITRISEYSKSRTYRLATPMIGELVQLDNDQQLFKEWWKDVR